MVDEVTQDGRQEEDKAPETFLEKVEESFNFTKDWIIKELGDHMSVHNAFSNLKAEVLSHVADHFGEEEEGEKSDKPA